MTFKRSISFKLIAVLVASIALVLLLANAIAVSTTSRRIEAMTLDQAKLEASKLANEISTQLIAISGPTAIMAQLIGKGRDGKYLNRAEVVDMLRANTTSAMTSSSWFSEEPNAFDGKAHEFVGKTELGTAENGDFSPVWTKINGQLSLVPVALNRNDEFYRVAAQSRKGYLTEPYVWKDENGTYLLTTISYPVLEGSRLIGVTGNDIDLTALSSRLSELRPFGSGRVRVISQTGNWIVAPSPDLLTKQYEDAGREALMEAVSSNKPAIVSGVVGDQESFTRVLLPFDVPGLQVRWVVCVDIPTSVIGSAVTQQIELLVTAGVIVLLAIALTLFVTTKMLIQRPIIRLVATVEALVSEDYKYTCC